MTVIDILGALIVLAILIKVLDWTLELLAILLVSAFYGRKKKKE